MPQAPLNITVKGLDKMQQLIRNYIAETGNRQKLHDRIGDSVIGWIDKNFKAQGLEKPWKPLRPSTMFAKRMAGVGAKALEGLRSWVTHRASAKNVVIGFPSESPAKYHHFGTKGPYEIRPKNKKALRFLMPPFSSIATGQMRTVLSPRPKDTPVIGMTKGNKQSWLFTQVVHHPGLPARPLLPSVQKAEELAKAVIEDALMEMVKKGGR